MPYLIQIAGALRRYARPLSWPAPRAAGSLR